MDFQRYRFLTLKDPLLRLSHFIKISPFGHPITGHRRAGLVRIVIENGSRLFFYPSQPDKQVPLKTIRLRPEANWDQDFIAKPAGWSGMSRQDKARLILEGKSINRADRDWRERRK
jgi:hypothetical protein